LNNVEKCRPQQVLVSASSLVWYYCEVYSLYRYNNHSTVCVYVCSNESAKMARVFGYVISSKNYRETCRRAYATPTSSCVCGLL